MTTAKKTTKKTGRKSAKRPARQKSVATVTATPTVESSGRRLRPKTRRFFRWSKPSRPLAKLPNVWQLTRQSARLLGDNWKVILGIVAVYGFLNIVLVRGLNGGLDVVNLKHNLDQLSRGGWSHLGNGFSIFTELLSSSNTTNTDVSSAYQTFIVLITSLALVWTFRQLREGKSVRVRDGFYAGTYPLIPVILLLMLIGLQLIPMLIGGWLFTTVVQGGIAIGFWEQLLWGLIFFALTLVSVYLMSSSIFALYIATLPGMTPMKALRAARRLVRGRRSSIVRKLLFLPVLLLIAGAVIMMPFILLVPVLAQWIFFGLSMACLAVIHCYMYTLYRSLLPETPHA